MTKLFFIVLLAALALVNSSPVTSEQQVDQSVDLLARDSEVDAAKSPMAKRCHAALVKISFIRKILLVNMQAWSDGRVGFLLCFGSTERPSMKTGCVKGTNHPTRLRKPDSNAQQ
ncbi:hypothetical protein DL96DRAFT_1566831 [Flagelloscypha sp. PMI_526]|nr:hypothetical protein DL96DRAFT_1566831 [Flagelloscypha sp. PMI_526]